MKYLLRSVSIVFLLTGICGEVIPQEISYATSVIEYQPAPGQFINNPLMGTPEATAGIVGQIGNPVSLGGYGGYIVFGFGNPIKNNPYNPFGIDFIIAGNAMENSSEQGMVMVMKDENKNGIPDDTWYEIRGSDHFISGFRKDYRIRYDNPKENTDIPWFDNYFASGFLRKNSYHTQPYYPSSEYFPNVNPDSLVFAGSLLPDRVREVNGIIISARSFFGYADNTPFKGVNHPLIPDNPYTPEVEGCGGDGIDISWAVNGDGNYVEIDEIDFIKIYTGVNRGAGWLGEISTEVRGIILTKPVEGLSGEMKMIMPLNIPEYLSLGSSTALEAMIFQQGRPLTGQKITWESSDHGIASFNDNVLISHSAGKINLTARLESEPAVNYTTELRVFRPSRILLREKVIAIRRGESRSIRYKVFDDADMEIFGSNIQFDVSEPEFIDAFHPGGSNEIVVEGLKEGYSFVQLYPSGFEDLAEQISVHVFNPLPEVSVLFSMRNNEEVIIPRRSFSVSNADFSDRIDRKPDDYLMSGGFVSLATVISEALTASGFNSSANTFRFRIDEKSGDELYLWQFARNWEFIYGWGGSTESMAFSACWVATVNGNVYLNGFDKIPVRKNDMISLNYVKDISQVFREIIIIEDENNDPAGMIKEFRVLHYEYNPDGNARFNISHTPLSNEKILINSLEGSFESTIFTRADGDFTVQFENPGVFRIQAERYPGEEIIVSLGVTSSYKSDESQGGVIYPNPVDDELNIRIARSGYHTYEISDMTGKKILSGRVTGGGRDIIPVFNLNRGMYILEVRSDDGKFNFRFLKK